MGTAKWIAGRLRRLGAAEQLPREPSGALVRADGKTLQAELDYVKAFVRPNFGEAAYRRMAMKNHPDKVASLGPDVQKAAEEKFRKIQEAYETIKKQRGIK